MPANNLTRQEATERALLLSGVSYRIRLDLTRAGDKATETFPCDAEIRFRASTPGAATFIEFLAPAIERAELNGQVLPAAAFDGGRLELAGLAEDNVLVVAGTAEYNHDGVGLHRFID